MAAIRVLVVEDSLTIRRYLAEKISSDPGFEVIGEAGDGKRAIELCEQLKPDVVTMDMMLPVMSGLAATEYIMAYCPTPILIVSASTNRGELFRLYDALAAGAIDVLEKPAGEPDAAWTRELLKTLRLVSRIRVITHPRAKLARPAPARGRPAVGSAGLGTGGRHRVLAIGASTGGPGAVLDVLSTLPKTFALPVLLVIHISEPFGAVLAEWLSAQTGLSVRYALDGEMLPAPGACSVLMAQPGKHLELVGERLRLTDAPERHSCRPSVDVMFESLAAQVGSATIACLLTGMGKDGAQGLLAVRRAGGFTIAQDEASSVVFGMPGEAVKLGAASRILPLTEIGRVVAAEARPAPGGQT